MQYLHFMAAMAGAAMLASPALAAYRTVNLDTYVNGNVAINPQHLPQGVSTGNKGLDIPFDISASPLNASYSGVWNASRDARLDVDLTGLDISGQASFYALLNNIYGTENALEYRILISTASGKNISYDAIGGINTRDYNANVFTNNIASTTTEWYNNGRGQRYDVRVFTLPASWAGETITSFSIQQVHAVDSAIFAGLTFSDEAPVFGAVPEPASWAMLIAGFGMVGMTMRRRRAAHA